MSLMHADPVRQATALRTLLGYLAAVHPQARAALEAASRYGELPVDVRVAAAETLAVTARQEQMLAGTP